MEEEPWDESEPGALPRTGGAATSNVRSHYRNAQEAVPPAFSDSSSQHQGPSGSYDEDNYNSENVECEISNPHSIRQEALKILELADAPSRSGGFAVHRTSTGGFAASHSDGRRVPAALSGSLFATSRTNIGAAYRDNATRYPQPADTLSGDDLEYGDEDVLDAIARVQQHRTVQQTPASGSWSSRYSLDRSSAAAMGLGSPRTAQFLDRMDRGFASSNRTSATGLTASSAYDRHNHSHGHFNGGDSGGLFGSGFSFRQSSVWGKQGVVAEQNQNLYDAGSQLPDEPVRKSWQEQVRQRRRQRRNLLLVLLILLVFVVTISVAVVRKNRAIADEIHLNVYVTSDVPYSIAGEKAFIHDLEIIRSKADFLVHLGNIQNVSATFCALSQYLEVSAMLQESKIPTFVVPGEDDWANCPDQQIGFQRWANTFVKFEHRSGHSMQIDYQQHRMENFAFVQNQVLFVGVHVIGGKPTSYNEFESRMKDNMAWIKAMFSTYSEDVRGVVVFGNAAPDLIQLTDFFDKMSSFLGSTGKPVVYVHANSGLGGVKIYKPFASYSNMVAVQAPVGGKYPPLPITINSGKQLFSIGGLAVPYRA